MRVILGSLTEEAQKERDYRNAMEISVDGKRVFSAWDGEPEDATLARDFNDCWSIPELMEQAYSAGVANDTFSIERRKEYEF